MNSKPACASLHKFHLAVEDDVKSEILISYIKTNFKNVQLTGAVGKYPVSRDLFLAFNQNPEKLIGYFSKEVLYSLSGEKLNIKTEQSELENGEIDPRAYEKTVLEFRKEMFGSPVYEPSDKEIEMAQNDLDNHLISAIKENGEIVSIARYIRVYKNYGLVGSVFTPKKHRSKVYSKLCMKKLIKNGADKLGLKSVVLCTGETNLAAQKVYESLGFKKIGYIGFYRIS